MLKNYIIEKELGKGTYGVVYKAKKKSDNNTYVIKQISLQGLTNPQKSEVKLESDILKKIKSKYVVQYYDSFEEENKLNIVMEYCECGDLNDFIERQKKTKVLLHEKEIWKFFIKITLGLADIHKIKILHRDLKSLNIFLKKENDVRVGDLGVAKILNQTFFAKTFIGTPYYLSPEICEDKPYNDKSDVWALGCILYELCTYQHPFTAKSQGGLILKILNDNPKPINSYYSKDLSSLVDALFNKDFQKRPSCEEILRMKCVIEKAKSLGIFEDIKNSFPNIEAPIEKLKISKNNKIKVVQVKPIIHKNRPPSNYGIFGKGGYNIKFNNIKSGDKKKNQNPKVLNLPNKEKKPVIPKKNIKIISNKDKNKGINSNNKVRKKVVVSPAKKEMLNEAEKFKKKWLVNKDKDKDKIKNIHIDNNNNKNPTQQNEKNNKKETENTEEETNITKEEANIENSKKIEQIGTINQKMNYSIDTKVNLNDNKININDINKAEFEISKLSNDNKDKDNNNCSIESDIYMTAKRDIYQPQQKEEKKDTNIINFQKEMEGSLPLMQTKEFNDLLSDFETTKNEKTINNNNFNIIDNNNINNNNNNDLKKNDFTIISNNTEEMKKIIEKGNIDNNKSISSCEEEDENENGNENSNEESGNDEEEEKVTEIDNEKQEENDDENIEKDNIEEEKASLKKDLEVLKGKIDYLKKEIHKLIGEEKFKYIMEISMAGIKDDKKQEEVNDKIENFIKENNQNGNEEKLYDILSLFILECQFYKKQEKLNKL